MKRYGLNEEGKTKRSLAQKIGLGLLVAGGILEAGGLSGAVALKHHAESGLSEEARYVMAVEEDPGAQADNRFRARYDEIRAIPEVQAAISEYKQEDGISFALLVAGSAGGCMLLSGFPVYNSGRRRKEGGQ